MKKLLILLLCLLALGVIGRIESTYTRQVEVVSITNKEVLCRDNVGYLWSYKNDHKANIGDKLILVMNDKHTSIIDDDTIIKVKER